MIYQRFFALFLVALSCAAQFGAGPQSARSQQSSSGQRVQGPPPDLLNAVPSGEATSETLKLTQVAAIERGLQYNLGMISTSQDTRMVRAQRLQTLADLLPSLAIRPSVSEQQTSLAAFGFSSFPGVPGILGPFSVFDARASLSAPLLDIKNLRKFRAQAEDIKASELNHQEVRDEVIIITGGIYLMALADVSRIESVRAQVEVAEALYKQAADRKSAGTAPALDVIRAEVQWKTQQQRLIAYEGEFEKRKLMLARAIGLPLAQKIELVDHMPYDAALAGTPLQSALDMAYRMRPDYQAKQAEVRAAVLRKQSAAAGRLPSITLDANYGVIGARIDEVHGTFGVAGTVNIPVYQGGRVQADVAEADAELQKKQAELSAMKASLEAEVRTALMDLSTTQRQVDVAVSNRDLAKQQLQQSRDRFAAGVTNNLEVVEAQQAVAASEESYISSLYSYNVAATVLARSYGGQFVIEYLKGRR